MYDGGYYLLKQPLIRGGLHKHTAANPDAIPDRLLAAVNTVQDTRWQIDTWMLDLMRQIWIDGCGLGVLPSAYNQVLPDRLPDEVWGAMSPQERSEHQRTRMRIVKDNRKSAAKRESFLRRMDTAETFRGEPVIWFPHFIDFRGRLYPLPQDLTPQGEDTSKALLRFADGVPLGPSGVSWLAIRLANCYGQDKLTIAERLEWVMDHEDLIRDSADDPLDGQRFWAALDADGEPVADEPLGFLATCREWTMAHAGGRPEEFISHLPIPMDGVANGLQHLSLLGKDPVGARVTCCTSDPIRYDPYTEVADEVKRIVSRDAAAGITEAQNWIGKVGRKTVKRAVMTTPLIS